MKRKNHVICRLCTNSAKLEEIVVSKNSQKELHKYSKSLVIGDQMKVNLKPKSVTKEINESQISDNEENKP